MTVALEPAPFRGVLPLPFSAVKASSAVLRNPANRHRAVPLSFEQFRYGFANAVSEEEAKELYEQFAVPGPGAPIFEAATANFDPWTEAKVNIENPDRGPLLITGADRTIRFRGRSPRRRTSARSTTPGSPRSSRSPATDTRSRSTIAGRRSPRSRSSSSSASPQPSSAATRRRGQAARRHFAALLRRGRRPHGALPRPRVGPARARRARAVRADEPRGLSVRAVVADDPRQARRISSRVRRLRPRQGRALRRRRCGAPARRHRHRSQPREDRGDAREREAALALRATASRSRRSFAATRPRPGPRPRAGRDVPARTPETAALARELKRRGFRFVGPTTLYALMQACGLVDDHLAACPARPAAERARHAAELLG